jgi:uncharacterized protein
MARSLAAAKLLFQVTDMAITRLHNPLPPHLKAWRELGWLYCANGMLSVVFGLGYIARGTGGILGTAAFCLPLAVVTHAFYLNLVPAFASAAFQFLIKKRWFARVLTALCYALLQIALVADVILFRMFHRHFDKATWMMLTSEGAGDAIIVGFWNNVVIVVLILLLATLALCLSFWLAPKLAGYKLRGLIALIVICVVLDKEAFAYCDLKEPTTVYWMREYLPLYPSLSVRGLSRRLGVKVLLQIPGTMGTPDDLVLDAKLNVPKNPIGFGTNLRRPNILVLLVESARADALNPEVMPNVWRWKDEALWLTNHYSSGHATREAVFGALYGLPASYLVYACNERKGAPLLDALLALHYDVDILSCANLGFPLCKISAFVRVPDKITDKWKCATEDRDLVMTGAFLDFLQKRGPSGANDASPFFGFLFYDASHQPYFCPRQFQLHPRDDPETKLNYAHYLVNPSASKEAVKYYENGLHYIDSQIGRVIDGLKAENMYDNTIIILAGDHGEEFGEQGCYGHGSSFNQYQTHPLCVVRFPGGTPGVSGRMTSHVDFVPSILTWMGATNAIADYSTGCDLNRDNDRAFVLCSDPWQCALIQHGMVTVCDQYKTQSFDSNYDPISTGSIQPLLQRELIEATRQRRDYLQATPAGQTGEGAHRFVERSHLLE